MNFRIFIKKKEVFDDYKNILKEDLNLNLNLDIKNLDYYIGYDIFNTCLKKEEIIKILTDNVCDIVLDDISFKNTFSIEYLSGCYDHKEEACKKLLLLYNDNNVIVKPFSVYQFDKEYDFNKIKKYLINPVETKEKDLNIFDQKVYLCKDVKKEIKKYDLSKINDVKEFIYDNKLSFSENEFNIIKNYYIKNNKIINEIELKVLDTFLSDHCRHKTFNTKIKSIEYSDGILKDEIVKTYNFYKNINQKDDTFMNLSTAFTKYRINNNLYNNLEKSVENNCCSTIFKHNDELYYLLFKNETHNHPTEIEPIGGASTCIGGAIRDILSARGITYQGIRVSGCSNIKEEVKDTLKNKLSQKVISKKSAIGFSSYANEYGLSTTLVKEYYDDSYKAKHLECGALLGVSNSKYVKKELLKSGDVIVLVGGRTGKDGIGGASGSSLLHSEKSINLSSEVQKGNALIEKSIERFITDKEVSILIKKCNDFGAGGVSVCIPEMTNDDYGVRINLDNIKTKYNMITAYDLALSESQERMAIGISKDNLDFIINKAFLYNLEATLVAEVINDKKVIMEYKNEIVCDISKEILNERLYQNKTDIYINCDINDYNNYKFETNVEKIFDDLNNKCNKNMQEMFDSSVNSTTVLASYSGIRQKTYEDVSVSLIPISNNTNICSAATFGFSKKVSRHSNFLLGINSVLESVNKLVAAGVYYKDINLSYQEYFKKLNSKYDYGNLYATLLGQLNICMNLGISCIGGKDSMSGTYIDKNNNIKIDVVDTFISFAYSLVDIKNVISSDFKEENNYIYLLYANKNKEIYDFMMLKDNYEFINKNIQNNKIISAKSISDASILNTIIKMSLGNKIGFDINIPIKFLEDINYSYIICESKEKLDKGLLIGVTKKDSIVINQVNYNMDTLEENIFDINNILYKDYESIIPKDNNINYNFKDIKYNINLNKEVNVLVPVFSGTNSDIDIVNRYKELKCNVTSFIFNDLDEKSIKKSIIEFKNYLDNTDILVISGGFSLADEPDGSAKFIAQILKHKDIKEKIDKLISNKKLILGICNGFQALLKAGLLCDYNDITLYKNNKNRHVAKIVNTKCITNDSPWLYTFKKEDEFFMPISHGEGRIIVSKDKYEYLKKNNMIASVYINNENGSYYDIEGIISKDGLIYGKMGHSERYKKGLYKNIFIKKYNDIFTNSVNYIRRIKK